jgi:hypothetical protein
MSWIQVINYVKGKIRKSTKKNEDLIEKLQLEYEAELREDAKREQEFNEERYLNKLYNE